MSPAPEALAAQIGVTYDQASRLRELARTKFHERRRKYVGSSDIAALFGKDPWRSAMDVYLSKTQEIEDKPNPAMQAGTRLEPVVLDWFEQEQGKRLHRGEFRVGPNGVSAANHDALVIDAPEGVEAKTANLNHHSYETMDAWGDEQSEDVPDHVLLQCQHQMYVSDLAVVWVPALIGGRGFCLYKIERNDRIIARLSERADQFWFDHVVRLVPPPESVPSLEIARRIARQPNKTVQLTAPTVQAWLDAKAAAKDAEKARDAAEAVMLAYMGDAEAADTPLGQVTFFEQSTTRLDQSRLKAERPEICDEFEKTSICRVLRHKAPKGEKVGAK